MVSVFVNLFVVKVFTGEFSELKTLIIKGALFTVKVVLELVTPTGDALPA